jgi:membrane protein implicated in regulation of membrane protease activity
MELIFGVSLGVGVVYLLLSILGGLFEGLDLGVDSALVSLGLDGVLGLDGADAAGLGCSVLAAFAAAFGAVGLVATLSGWGVALSILVALAIGLVIARFSSAGLRYVYSRQHSDVTSAHDLVGMTGRVTITTPAGATGEIMVENREIERYPVREIDGQPLARGDVVEIVALDGNELRVRKISS